MNHDRRNPVNLDLDSELNPSGVFSGHRSVVMAAVAAALLFAMGGLSGCSQLMGGLRPDLNDEYRQDKEPTTGGRFSEASMLDDNRGRGPDSEGAHADRPSDGRMGGQGSWLQAGEDERMARGRPSREEEDEDQPKLAARPVLQKKYKNGNRATRADFVDDSRDDGSLWTSEGQTNYFLTKNQIKSEGDLVTVITDEEFLKDIAAELKRTMSPDDREVQMDIAQERARRVAMGLPETDAPAAKDDKVANSQSAPTRAPASEGDEKKAIIPSVTWAQVDLRKSMELKAGDPVMMEVLERYPNGNYKLRGLKKVRLNGQSKMVSVIAIAKNTDITADETIPAGKLYEYRIEAVR